MLWLINDQNSLSIGLWPVIYALLGVPVVCASLGAVALLIFHVYLMCRGRTTREQVKKLVVMGGDAWRSRSRGLFDPHQKVYERMDHL